MESESNPVALWTFPALAPDHPAYSRCLDLLSPGERARALSMRPGHARDEAVTGRAVLRLLLAPLLGVDPRELGIAAGQQGKPAVDGMHFNVSHSRGEILIGLSRETQLGVDLEWIDPLLDPWELAREHFTGEECQVLATAANPRAEFFRLWTRKEAVLKALGCGLVHPLNTFSVLLPEGPLRLSGELVFLEDLRVEERWAGAVATLGEPAQVTLRRRNIVELADWLAEH